MKTCLNCKIEKDESEFRTRSKSESRSGMRNTCKQCKRDYDKIRHVQNRDKNILRAAIYQKLNRDKINKSNVARKNKNRVEANKKIAAKVKARMDRDPLFKLRSRISNRIYCAFKRRGSIKNVTLKESIGIDLPTFKIYMQKQFKKGMTWGNYGMGIGKWNVDHKIPLSSAKTEEELILLFHYTNLQPLWHVDNMKKSNKILPFQIKLTL